MQRHTIDMVPLESPMHSAVRVALPGTCGELVQGTLDEEPCLISCPIDSYSIAEVCFQPRVGWTVPEHAPKTRAALQAGLASLGRTASGGYVRLQKELPRGRGYGSSTADIGATLYALGQAAGREFVPSEVARLAVHVEPTDSSLFPGLVLWDHRYGRWYEDLGLPPALTVVVLDPGGVVDTLAFNQRDHRNVLRQLAPQHHEAFSMLREGLHQGNLEAVGAAATLSAMAHQAILANPLLESALALAHDLGVLGVCRAHSGTLLGLLLDSQKADIPAITARAARHFAPAVTVYSRSLVSGGLRLLTDTMTCPSR